MKTKYLLTFFIFLSFAIFFHSWKVNAEVRLETNQKVSLSKFYDSSVEVLLDKNNTFQAEQVLRGMEDIPKILLQKGHSISLGYMLYPAWIKMNINNVSPTQDWVLSLFPATITDAEVFLYNQNHELLYHTQYDITKKGENGAKHWMSPKFNLKLTGASTLLVKVYSPHNINLDMVLNDANTEEKSNFFLNLLNGVYLGIIIVILFYTLTVYSSLKEVTYLYYIFFLLSVSSVVFVMNGYANFFFAPGFDAMRYLDVFSGVAVIATNLFAINFLHLKQNIPVLDKLHKIIMSIAGFVALCFMSSLFQIFSNYLGFMMDGVIVATVILIFISAGIAIKKGLPSALFFGCAWVGFLLCILYYFLGSYNFISATFLTRHAVQIGSAVEMILLSAALSARIKEIQIQKRMSDQKAEQADRLRSLVHITCHDLANPLSVILHNAEIGAHRGEGNWQAVLRASHHQKAIIDFVRTQEAIDTGKTKVQLSAIPVKEVIEDVQFIFKKKLAEKRIMLNTNWEQIDETLKVQADPTLLAHSILNNLISNAIKFSYPDSEIDLKVEVEGSKVVFMIVDRGMGIPKKLIPDLFSNFHKTTREGTSGEKGTGFGMPLVKEMVDAFGGEIKVESYCEKEGHENHGSTFKVYLIKSISA